MALTVTEVAVDAEAGGEPATAPAALVNENIEAAKRSMTSVKHWKSMIDNLTFEMTACQMEARACYTRVGLTAWRIPLCGVARLWLFPFMPCESGNGEGGDSRQQLVNSHDCAQHKVDDARRLIAALELKVRACEMEAQAHLARAQVARWCIVKTATNLALYSYNEEWIRGVWARMVAAGDDLEKMVLMVFSAPKRLLDPVPVKDFDLFFAGSQDERRAKEFIDECSELYCNAEVWHVAVRIGSTADYHGVFADVKSARDCISALEALCTADIAAVNRSLTVTGPSIVRLNNVAHGLRNQMRRKETHAALVKLATAALAAAAAAQQQHM